MADDHRLLDAVRHGPCSFTVVDKLGNTSYYGTSADSQIKAVINGQSAPDVRVWALQRSSDLNGNTLSVSYTQTVQTTITQTMQLADGQYYPLRMDYTANSGANLAANRSVRFVYGPRSDTITQYSGGGIIRTAALLTHIQTYVGDTPVKDYHLNYATSLATGRSTITSVQDCAGPGANDPCLPATEFQWQGDQQIAFAPRDMEPHTPIAAQTTQLIPLDLNGDGRGDLVHIWGNTSTLNIDSYLSNGSTFTLCPNSSQIAYADGDPLVPMDVNGDGRADLVQTWHDSNSTLVFTIYFAHTDACGFAPGTDFHSQQPIDFAYLWPVDINGDGRADEIGAWADQSNLSLVSFLGAATSFTNSGTSSIPVPANQDALWPMDVNGDGMVDLVQAWSDQSGSLKVTSYLSNSTVFGAGIDSNLNSGTVNSVYWPMDVNGDGLMDLIQVWLSNNYVQLSAYFSDGAGHFVFGNTTNTRRGTLSLADFWPMDSDGVCQRLSQQLFDKVIRSNSHDIV